MEPQRTVITTNTLSQSEREKLKDSLDPNEIWINSLFCKKCCYSDKSYSAVWPCTLAHGREIYDRRDCPKQNSRSSQRVDRIETQTL